MKKRPLFFLIISIIFLFNFSLVSAKEIENVSLKENLLLSEKDTRAVIHSLIQVFHNQWILSDWGYASPEELAVPGILREVVRVDALNYLLIDAPARSLWLTIKGALDLYRLISGDAKKLLEELEKKSVKYAVKKGEEFLFQKEARIATGAIKFKYKDRQGKLKEPIIQYIIIYKPLDFSGGEMLIRFYSPQYLEPPASEGSPFGSVGLPNQLEKSLPPFIVTVHGNVKRTSFDLLDWTLQPKVIIEFPENVPDLGFRPLTFWQRHLLKPIEAEIRKIKVVITRIKEKPFEIVKNLPDLGEAISTIWQKLRKFISDINPFSPATLVEKPKKSDNRNKGKGKEIEENKEKDKKIKKQTEALGGSDSPKANREVVKEKQFLTPLTPKDIQIKLNDISKELKELSQKTKTIVENQNDDLKLRLAEANERTNKLIEDSKRQNEKHTGQKIDGKDGQKESFLCDIPKTVNPAFNKILINEIAWMGTKNSPHDEWIELKNLSNEEVNLTGWQLLNKEKKIRIIFGARAGSDPARVSAQGFFLLERTDDNTLPDVLADIIYKGALKNNDEVLYLFDQECVLRDVVKALPDWPAGDNTSKRTMERKRDFGWQASKEPEGTPKRENSLGYFPELKNTGSETSETSKSSLSFSSPISAPPPRPSLCSQENLSLPTYSPVIFNEIAWMGTAKSPNDEWFELKNISQSLVRLENWQILDKAEQIKIIFDAAHTIQPDSYLLLERTDDTTAPAVLADFIYTGALSNNDESLRLFDENCNLIDEVLASPHWPAGDKEEKRSMERREDLSWHTYNGQEKNGIMGTPRAANSQQKVGNESENGGDEKENEDGEGEGKNGEDGGGESGGEGEEGGEEAGDETPILDVVINEIGWMGTKANSADEWIELYNNTFEDINLEGWLLKAGDGTPEIELKETIPANGYYLLERTDNDTISDIKANLIYKGSLNNQGEILELRDSKGNLIDKVSFPDNWPGGELTPDYVSMERINPSKSGSDSNNWKSNNKIITNGLDKEGNPINGTPKSKNSPEKGPIILPKHLKKDITLTKEFNPYLINSYTTLFKDKTLTIEPGVIIKFYPGNNISLDIFGNLIAKGREKEKIIFTSLRDQNYYKDTLRDSEDYDEKGNPILPKPGDWDHLYFRESSSSILENVIILYGGYSHNYPNYSLIVDKANLKLKDIIFEKNRQTLLLKETNSVLDNLKFINNQKGTTLLKIQGGTPAIKNSFFKENQQNYLISIEKQSNAILENNEFEENKGILIIVKTGSTPEISKTKTKNNKFNFIFLISSGTSYLNNKTFYLRENQIPYLIENYLNLPQDLTLKIEPGTVIKIKEYLKTNGKIIAKGTKEKPIIFTSFKDDYYKGDTNNDGSKTKAKPGDWQGIYLLEKSEPILSHLKILYAKDPLIIDEKVNQENIDFQTIYF
jgi:hypothetical protein